MPRLDSDAPLYLVCQTSASGADYLGNIGISFRFGQDDNLIPCSPHLPRGLANGHNTYPVGKLPQSTYERFHLFKWCFINDQINAPPIFLKVAVQSAID